MQGEPKKTGTIFIRQKLYKLLNDVQNFCHCRNRRKIAVTLSLKIPPHFKYVATLPSEMSVC